MNSVRARPHDGALAVAARRSLSPDRVRLFWLGQAGFLVCTEQSRYLIDPFLSDYLAVKYTDHLFPHTRSVRPPIDVTSLPPIDAVLCSHQHSDHMDPWTLASLAKLQPDTRFVIPASAAETAVERGLPEGSIHTIDASMTVPLSEEVSVHAVASAHETIEIDGQGRNLFLGFVLDIPGFTIYHSGDCTPYAGLADQLRAFQPDLALLPVNGRDDYRRSNGVPGNFDFNEAVDLCRAAGIPSMIAHHYGMFSFNTISPEALEQMITTVDDVRVEPSRLGVTYELASNVGPETKAV